MEDVELLSLPYGWFIGFPEYLRQADMGEMADRVGEAFDRRDGGGCAIAIDIEEIDVLDDFLVYKSIRSRYN